MEEWTRWEPTQGLQGKYYLDSFRLDQDNLFLELSNEHELKKIQLEFNIDADSYRYTNESFCFKIPSDLSDRYGTEFYSDWSFFKITNSEYVQSFLQESTTVSIGPLVTHFCILGGDEIVDIIAQHEPKIKRVL